MTHKLKSYQELSDEIQFKSTHATRSIDIAKLDIASLILENLDGVPKTNPFYKSSLQRIHCILNGLHIEVMPQLPLQTTYTTNVTVGNDPLPSIQEVMQKLSLESKR
jgi:hypothetical protein